MKCAREGCEREAVADEFCSSLCAKRHHGVVTDDELERGKRARAKARRKAPDGYVYFPREFENRNRDRHEGPQTRAGHRRPTSGGR